MPSATKYSQLTLRMRSPRKWQEIVNAKYEKADLKKVASKSTHLTEQEQLKF